MCSTRAQTTTLVLASLLVAGCGDAGIEARTGGTAVVAYSGGPRSANPLVAADVYSNAMNRWLLFLPLVRPGERMELEPGLAESWEVEGDSVVVFHLRDDVAWSDGERTSAGDVAFTLDRALDPETGFPNRQHIAHWTRIQAPDSTTVRVSFDPARDPLYGFTLVPILPRHVLESVPATEMQHAPFNLSPVTNGPFTVMEARPGERWVFEANAGFPAELDGRPNLDRLVWRAIPESAAQEIELRAGEVDAIVGVRPESFDELVAREGLTGHERETLSYTMIAWNGRRAPLSEPSVRLALGLAIDTRSVIEGLRAGRGTPATGPVPPSHWAYNEAVEPVGHDPARATTLLRNAGLVDRDGDGVVENSTGEPFRITLLVPAGSDFNRDLAQVIQSNLAEIGVEVQIQALEFGTLVARITGAERDFDAVQLGLDADPRLDLRSLFHSEAIAGPFQLAGLEDARLDSILDALETEPRRESARELWAEAQEIVAELQPWSFLYYSTELIVARERLHGISADLRGVLHSAPEWWVDQPEDVTGEQSGGAG